MQLGGTHITIQPLVQKTKPSQNIEGDFLDGILEDFDASFSKKTISENQNTIIGGNITIYNTEQQIRLDKIAERIEKLDDSKPEYLEELIALETKKIQIEQEIDAQKNTHTQKTSKAPEEDQKQTVAELLAKKAFSYRAPIISPEEEEKKRLDHAKKAAETDAATWKKTQELEDELREPRRTIPILTHEDEHTISALIDPGTSRYQKAGLLREELIGHLRKTSRVSWFEDPQKNREWINDHIVKTAAVLSGKSGGDIDMHDIQTARLFLFQNTPQDIKEHPAYKYVESFYDFQYNQGHTGDIPKNDKKDGLLQKENTQTTTPQVKKEEGIQSEKNIDDVWDAYLLS